MTYGFTTIGAFARRDAWCATPAARRPTSSRWAGLGKESPVVAGLFAFFLLAMAGIPLTSGFTGKWAVFAAALAARRLAAGGRRGAASAVAAFFYVRVIVLMFFAEPVGEGPSVTMPEHADDGS